MMLLRARDNNIQSFAYTWLHKENQNEFLKHPKIKWLDGGFEPPTSGLPVHCCRSIAAGPLASFNRSWSGVNFFTLNRSGVANKVIAATSSFSKNRSVSGVGVYQCF